ncbi:restriction endonuclease subunit S [Xanthomonas phaseoli]
MLTGVGTIGVPYRVQKTDRFYFKDASVLIFKNHIADNSGYLLKYFVSPLWIEKIHAESMGTTVHTLTIARANETLCPLPPLAEQYRIVAKVDELMALCDRLEARQADAGSAHAQLVQALLDSLTQAPDAEDFAQSWQHLAEHFHTLFTTESSIDALKQTLLQLAVMGKLVPQDPSDEPASELCKSIEAEKQRLVAEKKMKETPHLEPVSTDEELFTAPSSWVWVRMGDICRPISSGSTPPSDLFRYDEGIPFLKVYNIRNQEIDFEYKKQFVSPENHRGKMKRSALVPGDVVMNIVGPPLGKVAIIPDTFPEWNCNQAIVFFGLIAPVSRQYIYTFLKEGSFLKNIALIGTAGQDNISVTKSKNIAVPLPPIAEQHRIVAKLDQLMALCDQLKSRLSEARQVHEYLANALIGQALSGEKKSGAEVVDFSAYLISKLAPQRTFGRVAHMKMLFLADSHLGLGLMDGYRRHAAGPLDTSIYRMEERAAQEGLYSASIEVLKSGQEKVSYHVGANISRSVEMAAAALGAGRKELDRLIALFEGRKTDDLEAVATLYAVWNDALAGGLHPNDEWLISEFRNNWHEAKERFTPDILGNWLGWMRDHGLVPTGNSAVTKSQAAFLFK